MKRGRGTGIRTLGGVTLNGFQDRRFRPLSHLPLKKKRLLEATPGFEPGIRALQARALPLGYAAVQKKNCGKQKPERKPRLSSVFLFFAWCPEPDLNRHEQMFEGF